MCSKLARPTRGQARVRHRSGAVLVASTSVLGVEAVIGVIALFAWRQTQEHPDLLPVSGMAILAVPFLAVVGAVLGALVSIGAVMPVLALAGWFGRRFPEREAWWWVPVLAAAAAAPWWVALMAVVGNALPALCGWAVATAVVSAAALVARRLLLPDRPRLSGAALFARVARYGSLAVVAAGVLVTVALGLGLGYEPPQLSAERVTGTWSDGKGGTLTLAPDGRASASGVRDTDFDVDDIELHAHECTGTGTWTYRPGSGRWSQEVGVSIVGCTLDTWQILGTAGHPKMFVFIGDPDSWNLYSLRRSDPPT